MGRHDAAACATYGKWAATCQRNMLINLQASGGIVFMVYERVVGLMVA